MNKRTIWNRNSTLVFMLVYLPYLLLCSKEASASQSDNKLVTSKVELEAAFIKAAPGDIIIMKDGIWNDVDILVKGEGTKEKPITLKAQTPGKVIISGKSSLSLSGKYLIVDGLYFKDGYSNTGNLIKFFHGKDPAYNSRITNIAVIKFNRPKELGSEFWVQLRGSHNRVDHSFFCEKISPGKLITVSRATDSVDYHQIDHNYFKDIPVLGKNGAEVVGVGWSQTSMSNSHTLIEYNLLENCNGEGELLGLKSGNNMIRYNTIVRSKGSISLRHGNGNQIIGNFIFGDRVSATGGIRIMGEGHTIKNNYIQGLRGSRPAIGLMEGIENSPLHGYLQIKNVNVIGNTLIDNEQNLVIGDQYNPDRKQIMPVLNTTIENNVIVGIDENTHLIKVLDKPVNTIFKGNILYKGVVLENQDGTKNQDPKLIKKEGIYLYSKKSPFMDNIINKPIRRDEVGPSWIKGMWGEVGIIDTPYANH